MALALVLLAAGASRRLGEPKALVLLATAPARTPLSCLLTAGTPVTEAPPLVVTGDADEAIRRALPPGVEACFHPTWEAGRSGSLAAAARARPGFDLLVAPVDVPLVTAATFRALSQVWVAAGAPAGGWLAPAFEEIGSDSEPRHGHPLVIGRELAGQLVNLGPDEPLRHLRRRARPLLEVRVPDRAILDDLDTRADLERLRARLRPD